ncbi:hypothetical protein CRYUN_Cryun10bG0149500 [Craigia yunnanensis]
MEGHNAEGDHKKAVETKDRGMFDFMKKDEDVNMADAHKPNNAKEEEKPTLMEKLHRSNSNSTSTSDEDEEGQDGEKKRKKKGLKEKIKEKISGDKEAAEHTNTSIPTENPEENKGFLDKIKEKLPGQHKKAEDSAYDGHPAEGEPKGNLGEHQGEDSRVPWTQD